MAARALTVSALTVALLAAPAAASGAVNPRPPTGKRAWIADLVAPTPTWKRPARRGKARWLQPLGEWTGGPVGLLVLRVRTGWVRVRLPGKPNSSSAWIEANRVHLTRTRWRVKVDVGARLVRVFHNGRVKRRFGAVVGAPGTPTPTGRFAIYEIAWQQDPGGFLGTVALHLTAFSDVLDNYGGGPGRVAIHGRGGASLQDPLGSAASHGCIRVDSRQASWMARKLLPGTPVTIVG